MWVATQTQNAHTHLKSVTKIEKKKEKAQRRWHPLCFHVAFEMKKKGKKRHSVCGGNVTTHMVMVWKSLKKKEMKK